jgi:hypothetical protein
MEYCLALLLRLITQMKIIKAKNMSSGMAEPCSGWFACRYSSAVYSPLVCSISVLQAVAIPP